MIIKLTGAAMILVSCAGFGLKITATHKAEERALSCLVNALDYMECELQYRLTPLPVLCRQAAAESKGTIREVFSRLSQELEDQVSPDVCSCMNAALSQCAGLPKSVRECLNQLGASLGRFDLHGQLRGLEAVRASCRSKLKYICDNKDVRRRSYQTLGICAGAALAILLI